MTLIFEAKPSLLVDQTFEDMDQLCDDARAWSLDFRPMGRQSLQGGAARLVQSRCGPADFSHARIAISLDQYGSPPSDRYTFVVMEESMQRLWWRGRDLSADSIMVFPIGSELASLSGPDFDVHTISIDESSVLGICENAKMSVPRLGQLPESFRPPSDWLARMRQQLRRLRDVATLSHSAEIQRLLELLVFAWLAPDFQQSSYRRPSLRARDLAVRRCLEVVDELDWTELSVSQLLKLSGASERTLQYAFRERFGLTPAAFLKARRLAAVRNSLAKASSQEDSIGDISATFGFWHVGQFAADYRRAFGELPSETLKRDFTRRQAEELDQDVAQLTGAIEKILPR